MGSTIDAIEALESCLDRLQRIDTDSLEQSDLDIGSQQTLAWLTRQIQSQLSQLTALKIDLETGLNPLDLGYSSTEDLIDFIEIIQAQIQTLERKFRELHSLSLSR